MKLTWRAASARSRRTFIVMAVDGSSANKLCLVSALPRLFIPSFQVNRWASNNSDCMLIAHFLWLTDFKMIYLTFAD